MHLPASFVLALDRLDSDTGLGHTVPSRLTCCELLVGSSPTRLTTLPFGLGVPRLAGRSQTRREYPRGNGSRAPASLLAALRAHARLRQRRPRRPGTFSSSFRMPGCCRRTSNWSAGCARRSRNRRIDAWRSSPSFSTCLTSAGRLTATPWPRTSGRNTPLGRRTRSSSPPRARSSSFCVTGSSSSRGPRSSTWPSPGRISEDAGAAGRRDRGPDRVRLLRHHRAGSGLAPEGPAPRRRDGRFGDRIASGKRG